MTDYIDVPIETDPQDILNDAYVYLQANIPGWTPAVGNLDVWLLESLSSAAAESRDVMSAIPKSIFRYFGANLLNIPPLDATAATVSSTWTVRDTLGYTIPAGTQVGIASSGSDLVPFVTITPITINPGSSATAAGAVVLQAVDAGADGSGLGSAGGSIATGAVVLLDTLDYVTGIALTGTTTGGQDAESDDDYLDRLVEYFTLLAPRPILPRDFAAFARKITGVWRATAVDGYNPFHNLLTANQASAETDASGWSTAVNCTVSSTSSFFADGTKSVAITSTGPDSVAVTPVAFVGAGAIPVSPGDVLTGVVYMRAATTVRACRAQLYFTDAAGTLLATATGAAANDSAATWTPYSITAAAPATAAFVRLGAYITSPVAGEVHYADKASIRRGTGTDWVPGGTAETGNEKMVAVATQDSSGAASSSPVKAAVAADLQARRELNFIVNVIDPTINLINITYTVKVRAGYVGASVITAVNAALTAYLNPAAWGTDATDPRAWNNNKTVRYLEIAQVINAVDGVDYITTTGGNYDLTMAYAGGTLARADISLGGAVPLPTAGVLTGTPV